MFADLWIISLFILYGASGFLLLWTLPAGIKIMRSWNFASSSENQLFLERKNYLVSALIQNALFFQIILLLFFLQLVNVHLPALIKGAMCAAGTLAVNTYGFMALYIKIAAVFIYFSFLFINYLDQSETDFPLTPQKYYLLFAAVLVFGIDVYVTALYFTGIKPDIIAACCSVNLNYNSGGIVSGQTVTGYRNIALITFYTLGLFIPFLIFRLRGKMIYLPAILSPLFICADITALKYHFVKFIYGMPAHNCLFDIFWSEYYFAGYLIFGTLAVHLISLLMLFLLQFVKNKLTNTRLSVQRKLKWIAAGGLIGHLFVLNVYWLYWII